MRPRLASTMRRRMIPLPAKGGEDREGRQSLTRHLLIFGLGYTASRLAARLRRDGWGVTATRRSAAADALAFDDPAVGDAIAAATHILSSVPPAGGRDAVLDRYRAPLAAAPARWLGYLSSTGVYGDTQGAWVDETAPVGGGRRDARTAADRAWAALRGDVRVFRLPGIYGPGRSALERVRDGSASRIDAPGHMFSRIHVDDIAAAVIASFDRGTAGIYNIADDLPAEGRAVTEYACALLGLTLPAARTAGDRGAVADGARLLCREPPGGCDEDEARPRHPALLSRLPRGPRCLLAGDAAMKFGVGQSVKRVEDARLLRGEGRYTDDLQRDGMLYGVTVRSTYAHAMIKSIDSDAARALPGVVAVYTHDDVAYLGVVPCLVPLSGPLKTPRHMLAGERVRFVGDAVAFVVATSREAARAGADAVEVDYGELPVVASIDAAIAPAAPKVWDEAASNSIFDWHAGDADAAAAGIAAAAHVTSLRIVQNRIAPTSMEVRAAVGEYDAATGYTLTFGGQGVSAGQQMLAAILKTPPEQIRVVTGDVGGGFGMKAFLYQEYVLVLHAAKALGKPVKWTGERGDAFQTDSHGRAMVSDARLGFDAGGLITALAVETWSDLGAYQAQFGPAIQTMAGGRIIGGVYRIPAIHNHVHGVVTNTAPVDAYRGAGRPESAYIMERLIEAAARELGLTVDDIRRRNLLRPDELPHDNGLGLNFDIGNFPAVLDKALSDADWAGFAARKAAAAAKGRRYGRGLAYYVEIAGGGSKDEFADIAVGGDGIVEAAVGTQSNGQGHETVYAQVLAAQLGLPMDRVRIVQGDTRRLDQGNGTGGSRSMAWGGAAVAQAGSEMVARGLELAQAALDGEVDYSEGVFRARASNRTLDLGELARLHPGGLDGRAHYQPADPQPTFPNGCHVAEVEIDPDTGVTRVVRYNLCDDFGVLVNPMLVEGQIHGGIAQGLGQALIEDVVYDDQGQLLTGSFMDYGVPRADDMPAAVGFETLGTPSPTNPLGVKGCGEAGTIGAMPSIMNAIIDALDGVQLEMPASPEKVWRICQRLGMRQAAE